MAVIFRFGARLLPAGARTLAVGDGDLAFSEAGFPQNGSLQETRTGPSEFRSIPLSQGDKAFLPFNQHTHTRLTHHTHTRAHLFDHPSKHIRGHFRVEFRTQALATSREGELVATCLETEAARAQPEPATPGSQGPTRTKQSQSTF